MYYVNFMFDRLSGSNDAILGQMRKRIKKGFYNELCNRCAHHPRAPGERHKLPEAMLFPDLPACKRVIEGATKSHANANRGFHFNGPIRIPPTSRFKEDLAIYVENKEDHYARFGISKIDVRPIYGNLQFLADYTTKTLKRGRASLDEVFVLPFSASEMRRTEVALSPRERTIRDIQSSSNVSRELAEEALAIGSPRDRSNRPNTVWGAKRS
jgi:hypothetical protein